jgi:uncharacterized protein with gpF-like domain
MHEIELFADVDIQAGPTPVEVLAYWRAKKLRIGFDHRDVWREEHDYAFSAAKIMRLDVLEAMRDEVDQAFAEGKPFAEFARDVEPRMKALGWWDVHSVQDPETGAVVEVNPPQRLRTIYETNMRTARAVGQYDRVQRNKALRPFLLYQVGPSARHREQHLAWHGLLLPVDDPFWSYAWPPNGWGCRCSVRTVSEREHVGLVRDGINEAVPEHIEVDGRKTGHRKQKRVPVRTVAPVVPLVPWENKRTGAIELVREGIDPGFDRRPGEGRRDALRAAPPTAAPSKPAPKRKR